VELYTQTSSASADYTSLAVFASEINGKFLTKNLVVTLNSDVADSVTFENVIGGKISIYGNGNSIYNPLIVSNCTCIFEIEYLNFSYSGSG